MTVSIKSLQYFIQKIRNVKYMFSGESYINETIYSSQQYYTNKSDKQCWKKNVILLQNLTRTQTNIKLKKINLQYNIHLINPTTIFFKEEM